MDPTLSHSPSTVSEVPVDTTTASAASAPALGSEPATTTETTGAVVVETSIATAAEAQAAEAHADHAAEAYADHAAEAKADTSTEDSDAQAAERAARAAQRKALKQRCHGHASHGASSYYYSVPAGREALPVPPESEREKICSFQPTCAPQNIRLRKYLRTVRALEVTAPDGMVTLIKLKPGTYEEHLALSQVTELLRASKRDLLEESMHDRFIAPAGLLPEDHHRVTYLINSLGPTHILAWARDIELPVYQALAQEVVGAWHDPFAEGLECCRREVPLRPNATALKPYQQALSERAAHWPEALRPLLGDLIKVLKECQPSKLHDYLVILQHLLTLSSKALHDELLALGQKLPKNFALAALIMPQAWEQAGCNLHKFLMATKLQPKKAPAKKRSSKRTAKAKLPELTPAPQADAAELAPVAADEAATTSELPELAPAPQVDATELAPVAADEAAATSELPELAPAPQADAAKLVPVAADEAAATSELPALAESPVAEADAAEPPPFAADEAAATSELPELAPAPQADAAELAPFAADEAAATSELPELAPAPQADATELAPVAEDKGAEASTDAQGATAVDASQAVDAFLAAKYNELRSATRGTHKLNPLACAVRTMLTAGPADADAAYEQDAILAPTMEAGAPAHADNPSSEPAAVMVELPSAVEPVQDHAGLSAWERKHQRKLQRQQRKQVRRHTSSGTGCPACGR